MYRDFFQLLVAASVRCMGAVIGIIAVYIIHKTSPENNASDTLYIFSLMTFFLNFSCFGIDQTALPFFRKIENKTDGLCELIWAYIRAALAPLIWICIAIIICSLSFGLEIQTALLPIAIFLLSVCKIASFFHQNKEAYVRAMLLLSSGFNITFTILIYMRVAHYLATLISAIIVLFTMILITPNLLSAMKVGRRESQEINKRAKPVFKALIMSSCITWLPFITSKMVLSEDQITFYSYCMKLSGLMGLVTTGCSYYFFPKIAKASKRVFFSALLRGSCFITSTFSTLFYLTIILLSGCIIDLIGLKIVNQSLILGLTLLGPFVFSFCGFVGFALIASENESALQRNAQISLYLTIISVLISLLSRSMVVFAVASSVGISLYNILCAISVYRNCSIVTLPRLKDVRVALSR